MKRGAIVPLALLGALLCVAGCQRGAAKAKSVAVEAKPVRVARVTRDTVSSTLAITGTLEAERRADVASKLTGRVERVLVQEGQAVRQGQVLATLDTSSLRAQFTQATAGVAAAQASLGAARAQLALLRAGSRPQEKRQAEEAVRQAKASMDNAEADQKRMQALFTQGMISRQSMDSSQLTFTLAQATYASAVQKLEMTNEGNRRESIDAQVQQVRQSEAALEQAQAARYIVKVSLDNSSVRSTLSGTVAKRYVEPGESLLMGDLRIAMVVDNSLVVMRGDVSEADIRTVQQGQTVQVTVDALPGRSFSGTIAEILPSANTASRIFSVKIRIANPTGTLKEGMFARAIIVTARHAGVLVISRQAPVDQDGKSLVFVVQGGTAKSQPVTLGVVSGDRVEVVTGLSEGDEVAVEGQRELQDGAKVTVMTEGAR